MYRALLVQWRDRYDPATIAKKVKVFPGHSERLCLCLSPCILGGETSDYQVLLGSYLI